MMFERGRVAHPRRRDLADELAAFANGRGGTMLLGVEDATHRVRGIPLDRLNAVEALAREICSDAISPPLDADIRKLELEDDRGALQPVLCIEVPRSLFVHRSPGGYFRRLGSSKRELRPEALARLFQERSQTQAIRFDETPVPGTAPEDLDPELTRRFLPEDGEPADVSLRKLRIVADDPEGDARLTVAGALLCTAEPQRWLPHAYIQAVNYASDRHDPHYQTDARDLGGPLDQQVHEALYFVRRNMLIGARKYLARVDIPQYSLRAVFEALVNAVAHRDYSMAGARVRLHMFTDRLELHVPGALSNTMTTDSMHLLQYSRNQLVVSLLSRCKVRQNNFRDRFTSDLGPATDRSHLMDIRGAGIPIIRRETHQLAGQLPRYALVDDVELLLTLPAALCPDRIRGNA